LLEVKRIAGSGFDRRFSENLLRTRKLMWTFRQVLESEGIPRDFIFSDPGIRFAQVDTTYSVFRNHGGQQFCGEAPGHWKPFGQLKLAM
jgi:hypothetical protein